MSIDSGPGEPTPEPQEKDKPVFEKVTARMPFEDKKIEDVVGFRLSQGKASLMTAPQEVKDVTFLNTGESVIRYVRTPRSIFRIEPHHRILRTILGPLREGESRNEIIGHIASGTVTLGQPLTVELEEAPGEERNLSDLEPVREYLIRTTTPLDTVDKPILPLTDTPLLYIRPDLYKRE